MADLAHDCGLGVRRLQRLHRRFIGVGPQWMIAPARVHAALARMHGGQVTTLADLATDLGWFDQARFNRDFLVLDGESPGGAPAQVLHHATLRRRRQMTWIACCPVKDLLLLLSSSANRVYADAARDLVAAEARVLTGALCDGPIEVSSADLAGVEYLAVSGADERLVDVLSNLSASAALFERIGDLLRPVPLRRREVYPSDLVTIPKYAGKTNEQWTRLALGVTAAATTRPQRWLDGSLEVLDPMCGRGTTLNLALSLGYDVTGVEIDRKDHEAYTAFIKTWMRQHRYKHTVQERALRTDGRTRGRQVQIEVAATKEDFRAGRVQRVAYLCTDTRELAGLMRARSVDVIVTDTPYGIQHGAHTEQLARSPLELLDQAMPGWARVLRSGGAMGISFNRHVSPRDELAAVLAAYELELVTGPGYDDLRHRVDVSIDRDLIVARKP